MTAFFLMYRMNNEYTARGEEPIQGILCLDEEKAAGKLHYLVREWQYFPGKLLTPDMLKENTGYYSRYISIGEYGGMELGDKNASPYGCGTYRMILILPKKEQRHGPFLLRRSFPHTGFISTENWQEKWEIRMKKLIKSRL